MLIRSQYRELDCRRSLPIAATTPQEALELFEAAYNAGDLDAIVALYEPNAARARRDGAPMLGRAAIAATLRPYLAHGTRVSMRLVALDEGLFGLALLTGAWTAARSVTDADTPEAGVCQIVLRRQPDGTWCFLIDDPGAGELPPEPVASGIARL